MKVRALLGAALSLALALLSACDRRQGSTLQALFTPDLIGEQIKYFEVRSGPAMHVDLEGWRTYVVGGCRFSVRAPDNEITAVRILTDPQCDVDLSALIAGHTPPALHGLTFGAFDHSMQVVSYGADCLFSCNQATPHGVYAWYSGASIGSGIGIIAEASQQDQPTLHAVETWTAHLLRSHDARWVSTRKFNCNDDVSAGLPPDLEDVLVASITIGRSVDPPEGDCSADSESSRDPNFGASSSDATATNTITSTNTMSDQVVTNRPPVDSSRSDNQADTFDRTENGIGIHGSRIPAGVALVITNHTSQALTLIPAEVRVETSDGSFVPSSAQPIGLFDPDAITYSAPIPASEMSTWVLTGFKCAVCRPGVHPNSAGGFTGVFNSISFGIK